MGKRSRRGKANVKYTANAYVDPNITNVYAEDRPAPRRMSDTIAEDEEFPSEAYGIDSLDEAYLGGTQGDLQLSRIQHLDEGIQRGIQVLAQGGSISGISPLDAAAAVEEFGSQIQGDPSLWANQLRIDETVSIPNSSQDKKMILSVLQNTSGEYFDKGPGSDLAGHTLIQDRQRKMDEDLKLALGYIDELSELYIDPRSKGHSIYGVKKDLVKQSLTSRFLDGTFSEDAASILPLPNETGVTGIRPTASYRGYTGTSFDRVGFDIYAEENNLTSEDSAFWEHKPNLKGSLFPKSINRGSSGADKAKATRYQDYQHGQALYKAKFARKILREQMPTNRDESAGQIRMTGWDTPYGDQAERMDLLNEAAIQDLDFQQASLEAGEPKFSLEMSKEIGKGSDREGAYGMRPISEVDVFIEKAIEGSSEEQNIEGIRQRTPEWYAARKGLITSSRLINESGRRLTPEELAQDLALERLGLKDKFVGNAHTREGNEGEKLALQAFLSGQKQLGNELQHTEVGLLQNKNFPGFGASPDGRLKGADATGETNEGLLELKYLTTGAMSKALAKYTPQMQLQMAITGEEQTHFFALDKYTGESIHEIVKADVEMQGDIFKTGIQAKSIEAGLDARGVQNMIKQSKEERNSGSATPVDVTGQTASFIRDTSIPVPMTGFRTKGGNVGDAMVRRYETAKSEEAEAIAQAWADSDPAAGFQEAERAAAAKSAQADKETAAASKEAANNIKELGKASRTAATIMGEIGSLITSGNTSGMDEVRLAGEVGLDTENVRGMREALVRGNLSERDATSVIGRAGALVTTYNDEALASTAYTKIMSDRGKSTLPEVRGLALPSRTGFQNLDAQEWVSTATEAILSVDSPEAKTQIAAMFGMGSELAAFERVDGVDVMDVDGRINKEGLTDTMQGVQDVLQEIREVKEAISSQGRLSGAAGATAEVASDVASSGTGAAVAGAVGTVTAAAASRTTLGKSLLQRAAGTVGKFSLPAAIASLIPSTTRYLTGTKDDGGIADSGLDILEAAAVGGGLGSIGGPVGAAAGALVGTGVGVLNEAYQYFTRDGGEAIPEPGVNQVMTGRIDRSTPVVNNIEVNTTVTPDSTITEVNENGDQIYLEEDSATGFAK